MNIPSEQLFNEFIKYHIPKFDREEPTNFYTFCANVDCSKCKVLKLCPRVLPTIKKEIVVEYIKIYPENGI